LPKKFSKIPTLFFRGSVSRSFFWNWEGLCIGSEENYSSYKFWVFTALTNDMRYRSSEFSGDIVVKDVLDREGPDYLVFGGHKPLDFLFKTEQPPSISPSTSSAYHWIAKFRRPNVPSGDVLFSGEACASVGARPPGQGEYHVFLRGRFGCEKARRDPMDGLGR